MDLFRVETCLNHIRGAQNKLCGVMGRFTQECFRERGDPQVFTGLLCTSDLLQALASLCTSFLTLYWLRPMCLAYSYIDVVFLYLGCVTPTREC